MSSNAAEFYGGPFFNDDGRCLRPSRFFLANWQIGTFIRPVLVVQGRRFEQELPESIAPEEADDFLRFMRRMLAWMPEDRATASELKNDPWLGRII